MDAESCVLRLMGVCQRAKNMLMQPQTDSRMSVRPHFGVWVFFTKCTIALLIMFLPTAMPSQGKTLFFCAVHSCIGSKIQKLARFSEIDLCLHPCNTIKSQCIKLKHVLLDCTEFGLNSCSL